MATQIITDTSCDLPEEKLQMNNIEMIPLKVTFDNGETFLDRFELPPAVFVKKLAQSRVLSKTAAPDPQTFIEYFERGLRNVGSVVFVSLSSGLSSTYQTAQLACKMLGNEKVKVFDTLTASLGTGIMAIKANQFAKRGMALEQIMARLHQVRDTREVIFVLDTLENVVKGGRLSRMEGLAGNLLNIKPVLRGNQVGVPVIAEKLRGRKKAVRRMVDMLGEMVGESVRERIVGISHLNCEEDAHQLAREVQQRYQPQEIIIAPMSATIGTYAGEGGLMINL